MTRTRYAAMAFVLTLAFVAACSSSSASSGNKDKFCKDNATLNAAGKNVGSASDLIQVFKDNKSTIDDFQKQAPSAIKSDADLLVNAVNKAISTGDASAFTGSDVQAAGPRVDAFCGQSSSSSTANDTGSSTDTTSSTSSTSDTSSSTDTTSSTSSTSSSTDSSTSS